MRLVSFLSYGRLSVGLVHGDKVFDLAVAYTKVFGDDRPLNWFLDMRSFLAAGAEAYRLAEKLLAEASSIEGGERLFHKLDDIRYLPPVPEPGKILCVATNYVAHGQEMAVKVPETPYFFTKFRSSLTGHNGVVLIPRSSEKADHEVELAVVIGRRGKYISRKEAMEYVAGYTVFNDVSFRDRQMPPGWPEKPDPYGMNWVLGKGPDTAAPCGPHIVTPDEVGDPYNLRLTLRVNGEVRQSGNTRDMYHRIDRLIEYVSDGLTLEPGDIIATGTPAGVAAGTGRPYLREGDVMEAEVEKIGLLRNYVVKEK